MHASRSKRTSGADEGAAGRSASDPFWARTAHVGLQGAFGTSVLGRSPTPLWTSTRLFNPFGDSVGFSPSIRQYFGGTILGDSRWNNSVAFSTPEVESGFMYSVQFNAGEGAPGSTGKNTGVNALYTSGPLSATGTWQRVRNGPGPLPAGFDHQSTFQFGASYEMVSSGSTVRPAGSRRWPIPTSPRPSTSSARSARSGSGS